MKLENGWYWATLSTQGAFRLFRIVGYKYQYNDWWYEIDPSIECTKFSDGRPGAVVDHRVRFNSTVDDDARTIDTFTKQRVLIRALFRPSTKYRDYEYKL
jgi:hypothetical protein